MSIVKLDSGAYNYMDTTGDEIKKVINKQNESVDEVNRLTGENQITATDVTQELSLATFHAKITTGHAASVASLADGTYPGQRKLITLETITTEGDVFTLDETNIHNAAGTQATSVTFDAEGEFLLLEWTGVEWQEVYGTATIATA